MSKEKTSAQKKWDIADILEKGIPQYKDRYGALQPEQAKVVNALRSCRTSKLGGHKYRCEACHFEKNAYNSCRNRHCPKCQGLARLQWIESRLEELLPVPYFHAVFTIPNELNPFALRNKRVIYDLQQQAISETFRELSEDPKYIGAKIGYIAVLHTWGQNLMDHPHIHCITPGGGITGRQKWKSSKKDFLFPIKVLSRLYKGKFMDKFQTGVKKGEIHFHGKLGIYSEFSIWKQFVNTLYDKEWVVYCKKPFSGPDQVLKYLGGYTHRIAISNHRILKVSEGMVTFTWKDYKNGGVKKLLTLKMTEFIRRFLLHVLPKGFKRIRYYGFLSNRIRSKSLSLCFSLLKKSENKARKPKQLKSACELLKQLFGIDLRICPKCGQGKLVPSFSSIKFGGGFY